MKLFVLKLLLSASIFFITPGLCDVCSAVESSSPSVEVAYPLSVRWNTEQLEYWSTGCSKLLPSCILYPASAQEVSSIVSVLRNSTETFAVKSGGHNPNNYFASVNGGPLISTARLDHVELDAVTETVRVGPGNRWDEVAKKLDGSGLSVVGGRLGNVGVGGYMLGGGLSFMSTEHGWAANNIIAYELVLPNATIATITRAAYPSLFRALQGGGNAFGIVTTYVVKAHRQELIWGGNLFFNATPEGNTGILKAVRDFSLHYPDDKAAVVLTAERTALGVADFWTMFVYYNGPTPPPGVFANFTALKPYADTCKTRSMSDLVSFNNWAVLRGSVYTIGTETTPLPPASRADDGLALLEGLHADWRETSSTVLHIPGLIASTAYQPIPRSMAALARAKGGDLLDLDDDVDLIIIEYNYSFLLETDRPSVDIALQQTYGAARERVLARTADGTLPPAYLPLFANDGYWRQDYFGRLRPSSRELARRARDEVDPEGLFADRTGGFKIGGD